MPKTAIEISMILSALADAMVLAHGKNDDYTQGVMDFAEMAARDLTRYRPRQWADVKMCRMFMAWYVKRLIKR